MDNFKATKLISDLLENPKLFNKQGKANILLQEYFHGLSVNSLRPLLRHENFYVRRSAAFIASELGAEAVSLLDDIVCLSHDPDMHTRWYCIESIMVCSQLRDFHQFSKVVIAMEGESDSIRVLAMGLVMNATAQQVEATIENFEKSKIKKKYHILGLKNLLLSEHIEKSEVKKMIESESSVLRKYGAIILKKVSPRFSELISLADGADITSFLYA